MIKINNLFLIFILNLTIISGSVSARLTKSMNCTFSCSGKRCQTESNTLIACLASCHPSYYKKCWDSGVQKFDEYGFNPEEKNNLYFKEFNMLDTETQNMIRETLDMAQKITSKTVLNKSKIDANYELQRNAMKKYLLEAAEKGGQDLKNWVRKALALEVKDAGKALSLGIAFSN